MKSNYVFIVKKGSNGEVNPDLIGFTDDKLTGSLAAIESKECKLEEIIGSDAVLQVNKEHAVLLSQYSNNISKGSFKLIDHEMIKGMMKTEDDEIIYVILDKKFNQYRFCDILEVISNDFEY